jgi:hypothetical protein
MAFGYINKSVKCTNRECLPYLSIQSVARNLADYSNSQQWRNGNTRSLDFELATVHCTKITDVVQSIANCLIGIRRLKHTENSMGCSISCGTFLKIMDKN